MTSGLERYTPPKQDLVEFPEIMRRAEILSKSQLVPSALRGKPEDIAVIALTGRDMGVPMMQALSQIYVIEGRPSPSAQLMLGLARRHGHDIWIEESTEETCTAAGVRRGSQAVQRLTWTIEMARKANLTKKKNWVEFPAAMLRARAISNLCRVVCPDALLGLEPMTPDELGQDVGGDDTHEVNEVQGDEKIVEAAAAEGSSLPPRTAAPPPESPDDLAGATFARDFAIACREAGMSEEERHALIVHATGGRVASAKEVQRDEVAALRKWFRAIASENYGFEDSPDGLIVVELPKREASAG